jgi:TP901 family phage tail tape measure protein
MSNAMKIALTFTAIDAASGAVKLLENRILRLGKAGRQVKKDFEDMVSHAQAGLKSLAASYYTLNALRPGIRIAADMQEAMIELEMSLQRSGKNAATMTEELRKFRQEADRLQKIHPYGAKEFAEAATVFVQAGMRPEDILGDRGALAAAGTLATIGHSDPKAMAQALQGIGATYGLKGSQYGELANYIQKIHTSTPLKIDEAVEALKYSGQMSSAMELGWKDTLTALATLKAHGAPGSMAGTELSNFLQRLTGATKGESKAIKEAGFEFWDESGHAKSMGDIIRELQGQGANPKMAGMTQKERMTLLSKIFAARGERAALAFADTGDNSFQALGERAGQSADAVDKLATRLTGLEANLKSLSGTVETAVANAFDPMLNDLTAMAKAANDLVDSLGKMAAEHRTLTKGIGYGVEGGAVALGGYGLFRLAKAAASGRRVWSGLRGAGSTAAGLAEGKILEKTAGVTPVFVTNWPAGGPGSAAAEAGAGKTLKNAAAALGASGMGPLAVAGAATAAALAFLRKPLWEHFTSDKAKTYLQGEIHRRDGETVASSLARIKMHVTDEEADRRLAQLNQKLSERPKNDITLNITVDQGGRVTSQSNDPNTSATVNLKRGMFMPFTD